MIISDYKTFYLNRGAVIARQLRDKWARGRPVGIENFVIQILLVCIDM